jgi:Uma2 family endonuclease
MTLQTRLTVEDYERFLELPENEDRRFELVNGEIEEKMPNEQHAVVNSFLHGELYIFLKTNPLGRLTIEARYSPKSDALNDRIPDIAFTQNERLQPVVKQGAAPTMPDLIIEVQSPGQSMKKMREKAAYFIANGAKLVWLVYPHKRLVEVLRANGESDILTVEDALSGEDILPGFELPVLQLFEEV